MGGGFGHLSRLEPIASQLRSQGHHILFVVKDVVAATKWLGLNSYSFLQAPLPCAAINLRRPPSSYAEILLAEGYGEPDIASGVIESWLNIIRLYRPDILISDHSPMAIFAARILNVRRVMVGSGFELPPLVRPFPCFRPWEDISKLDLEAAEGRVLATLNKVASTYRSRPINDLSDIFDLDWSGITSFRELDHYGSRSEANYMGPILSTGKGLLQHWRSGPSTKIFVYLQRHFRELQWVLRALTKLDAESMVVVPGLGGDKARALSTKNVKVFDELIKIEPLLGSMDLAISYGGVGVVNLLLLAGVPLFLIPQNIEQYMHSCRVEALGAGLVLGEHRDFSSIEYLINKVLADSGFSNCANDFKSKYSEYDSAATVNAVAECINGVLNDRSAPVT